MELLMYDEAVFDSYKSNSQRVRVLTERWMNSNMFCPACLNPRISKFPNNTPIADFFCQNCNQQYELKSQKNNFGKKINDGAYKSMIGSIVADLRPNFFLLNYDLDYYVNNLFLVPSFFFTESLIEKRKPLEKGARRKGWVGCNILISKIPPEGLIRIIENKIEHSKQLVLSQWRKISFMKETPLPERGWAVNVLNAVHSIGKKKFTLQDIYYYEDEFSKSHPKNYNIKAKIRQQLQILRDKGILKFDQRGEYSIRQ